MNILTAAPPQTDIRRAQVASATGRDPEQIKIYQYQLSVLRDLGILVDLNISGITMFERKASWDEIGFQPNAIDVRKERLSPGRKLILPDGRGAKELNSIAATLRQTLAKYSFYIPGFHPYKFLTIEAFQNRFRPKFDECAARWRAAVAQICANLDAYRDQLADCAALEAARSWQSIIGQDYANVVVAGKAYDRGAYIDFCVARDLAALPSAETVERTLKLDYVVAMVSGAEDIAADQARAEIIRKQIQIEKEHSWLENAQLQEQLRHEQYMHQLAENERRAKREIILQAEMDHVRKQLLQEGSPFDRIVCEARKRAADSAADILQSIKKNGFVRGKVAEKGAGLREYFELIAAHDDKYLLDLLKALEAQIGKVGDRPKDTPERDLNKISSILEQIVASADAEFRIISSGPGLFAAVEL